MNENEIKTCENDFPTKCGKVATVSHWDCCDGYYHIDLCVECAKDYECGSTTSCEWYNTIDGVVVASSDPEEIGVSFN